MTTSLFNRQEGLYDIPATVNLVDLSTKRFTHEALLPLIMVGVRTIQMYNCHINYSHSATPELKLNYFYKPMLATTLSGIVTVRPYIRTPNYFSLQDMLNSKGGGNKRLSSIIILDNPSGCSNEKVKEVVKRSATTYIVVIDEMSIIKVSNSKVLDELIGKLSKTTAFQNKKRRHVPHILGHIINSLFNILTHDLVSKGKPPFKINSILNVYKMFEIENRKMVEGINKGLTL